MKKILLDGAMGTMLQARGLRPGELPEVFGTKHPEVVEAIHRAYVDAGSTVIYTNTFGANEKKLSGAGVSVEEAVSCAVETAKRAADGRARVALSVGPLGELMQPLGDLTFREAARSFARTVKAGEKAGADIIVFETYSDLAEARAAVIAAKEVTSLPIWVTMSFEANGRTFTGTTAAAAACGLTDLGIEALGANCGTGPEELVSVVRELREWTDLPLIVKPNAGLPNPETGTYSLEPEAFAQAMASLKRQGAVIVGGCCGTTPEHIRTLAALSEGEPLPCHASRIGVCSPSRTVEYGTVHIVGERINPTGKKKLKAAMAAHDTSLAAEFAVQQEEAGAELLDVNVGVPGGNEKELMEETVPAVREVSDLPLVIDSSDVEALEAGLMAAGGKAVVNSVNADPERLAQILPLVKKYGSAVIGLAMDRQGIPPTAEARFKCAARIVEAAEAMGIRRENVWIDCLTLTASAQPGSAVETLKAVRMVKRRLHVPCLLGVSNISFGLPARETLTLAFLTEAMYAGLDFPIINPNAKGLVDAVFAHRALAGHDPDCGNYIARFTGITPVASAQTQEPTREMTVAEAVSKGLGAETAKLTEELLTRMEPLEVVETALIPALDVVGRDYENGSIFLPQLMKAASAACAGFDVIRARIAVAGGSEVSRGTIVLATVEGDIHDIGKNIVKTVLENYGYHVIDLGRDVPVQKVVDAVRESGAPLVGLAALMTITLPAMQKTIKALREAKLPVKIMAGGAVLTEDYAMKIGADYYCKNAMAAAAAAKEVFG